MYSNGALVMLTESKYMRRCRVIGGIARSDRLLDDGRTVMVVKCTRHLVDMVNHLINQENMLRASITKIDAVAFTFL